MKLPVLVVLPLVMAVASCESAISEDPDCPAAYVDADGDGFGSVESKDCDETRVAQAGDCDDDDPSVFPGADELCDGVDQDCDGAVLDEQDEDRDGSRVCDGDCDDQNRLRFPNQVEVCDGEDDDCDGVVDRGCALGVVHSCLGQLALRTENGDTIWQTNAPMDSQVVRGIANLGSDRHAVLVGSGQQNLAVYDAKTDEWSTIPGPGLRLSNASDSGAIAYDGARIYAPGNLLGGAGVAWFDPASSTSGWLIETDESDAPEQVSLSASGTVWALDHRTARVVEYSAGGRVQSTVELRSYGRVASVAFNGERPTIVTEAGDIWSFEADWTVGREGRTGLDRPYSLSTDSVGTVVVGGASPLISVYWPDLSLRSTIDVFGFCFVDVVKEGD